MLFLGNGHVPISLRRIEAISAPLAVSPREQATAVAGGMGHLGPTPAPAIFYAALPAFATALEARFFERTASYGLRSPEKLRRIAATFPLFHAVFSFPFSSLMPDFSQNCLTRSSAKA